MPTANEVNSRLNTHEAVCEERWKETIVRIKRLEHIMIGASGGIIAMLVAIATKMG